MAAIKRFFQKRKLDQKFRQAGEGHKLTDGPSGTSVSSDGDRKYREGMVGTERGEKPKSESALKAAEAALARSVHYPKPSRPASSRTTWKSSTIVLEARVEVKGGSKDNICSNKHMTSADNQLQSVPMLEMILFSCPLCPACLPESEIKLHIEECLHKDIDSEPAMVAATMIQTLNETRKAQSCVEILNKYLDNIIKHPSEEKYQKIRLNNKVFQEKVKGIKGVKELLTMAIGFVQVKLPGHEKEAEEDFYVLSEGLAIQTERLEVIKDYLNEAEALLPILDRNIKVYSPVSFARKLDFPSAFYAVSNQEIKREQQQKTESTEKSKQFSTRAMKAAEAQARNINYRFTLIRIKFPDERILEGTFYSKDCFSEVISFVTGCLEMNWLPFELSNAMGKRIDAHDKSLETLELSPAAILNFRWDKSIAEDLQASNVSTNQFLTSDLLARIIEL